ncbi:MAG: MoaD/ThiS family protein [Bacteroidota bacterium]
MAKIIIPTPLRKFTENQSNVELNGETIQGSIQELAGKFPAIEKHLFDDDGKIRSFVRIYLGDEDIKQLDNENTKVENDSVISIIPAIAGGIL